jgi:peptidyl-prolyl cis-trans isomerase C
MRLPVSHSALAAALAASALVAAALLSGCGDRGVLAEVGKRKILQADLEAHLARRPASERSRQQGLGELIERELLAEGARRQKLLDDPAVRAHVACAEREVLAQALLDKQLGPAADEPALRKLYEERKPRLARRRIHVAQIFVQLPPGSNPAGRDVARARAFRLYGLALQGKGFEELARSDSDDKVSGAQGGDLGALLEGQVDAGFFAAAAALKKGELAKPIETAFGVHVVRALEDPSLSTPTFEESRSRLAGEARREREAALLAELRGNIPVRVLSAE